MRWNNKEQEITTITTADNTFTQSHAWHWTITLPRNNNNNNNWQGDHLIICLTRDPRLVSELQRQWQSMKKIERQWLLPFRLRNKNCYITGGIPQDTSNESESYVGSAVWIMVCEQAKFHPHEMTMFFDTSCIRNLYGTAWSRSPISTWSLTSHVKWICKRPGTDTTWTTNAPHELPVHRIYY